MTKSEKLKRIKALDISIQLLIEERTKLVEETGFKSKPVKETKAQIRAKQLNLIIKGIPQSKKKSKIVDKVPAGLSLDALGRSGEVAFQNYLHEILDKTHCSIKWVNQGNETRLPYDFIVTICDKVYYFDVKATRGEQDATFYLSEAEKAFAKVNSTNYFVARLSQFDELRRYKADSFNVKILDSKTAIKLATIKKYEKSIFININD